MTDAMLMMRGSSAFISGRMKAFTVLKAPLRFVSSTVSQSSSFIRISKPSRVTPALLIKMFTWPSSSPIFFASSCTASWSATSTAYAVAAPG